MYCRKCGKELPEKAIFCSSCRTKVKNKTKNDRIRVNTSQIACSGKDYEKEIKFLEKSKEKGCIIFGMLFNFSIIAVVLSCLFANNVEGSETNLTLFYICFAIMLVIGCGMIIMVVSKNRVIERIHRMKLKEEALKCESQK